MGGYQLSVYCNRKAIVNHCVTVRQFPHVVVGEIMSLKRN